MRNNILRDQIGRWNGQSAQALGFDISVVDNETITVAAGQVTMHAPVAFSAVTTVSGSSVLTTPVNLGAKVGASVSGTGIPVGAKILSFVPGVSITISANATANGTIVLSTDNNLWEFAGGTGKLPHINNGDGEWYVGIDPNTHVTHPNPLCSKVHVLRWKIHSSLVWICKVKRTAGVVTISEFYDIKWPKTGISRFKAKLEAAAATTGAPVKIAILGTSLSNFAHLTTRLNLDTVPTSTTCDWNSLLFANDVTSTTAAQNSARYRMPYLTLLNGRFTVDNLSMSSNNVHYHSCWLADGMYSVSDGTPSSTVAIRPGSVTKIAASEWKKLAKSPLINEPYDLVIIDTTPNGGTHKMAHLDNIVRKLTARGVEVVLVRALQTDGTANPDLLTFTIPDLVKIAEVRGCDVCDWASFCWEAIDRFATRTDGINGGTATPAYGLNQVLQDSIHPSQNRNGNGLQAEALCSIFNMLPMEAKIPDSSMLNRVLINETSIDPAIQPFFPTHYEFQAFPNSIAGNVTYSAGAAGIYGGNIVGSNKMPENVHGKVAGSVLAATAPVIQITDDTGELKYSHPFAVGYDVLVDYNGSSYTFTVSDGTNTLKTCVASSGSLGGAKGFLFEGQQVTDTVNWMLAQSTAQLGGPFMNTTLTIKRLPTTGANPRIRGVLWQLPGEVSEIMPSALAYTGTWSIDSASNGVQAIARGTDTTSDYVDITCTGRMAFVHIEQTDASGIVDVWLNGEKIHTNLDTYRNVATGHGYLKILPRLGGVGATAASGRLPELGTEVTMDIRVQYTGTNNGAAVAPTASKRRLKIIGVSVIK